MQVEYIDTLHGFDRLKVDWDAVYAADSHAHMFVSWAWLRGWFEVTPYNWLVLAVRPDSRSSYVGFLPLGMRATRKCGIDLVRELHMGGSPCADYTGFVCLPEYEERAISTFAAYIQQLKWDRFHMKDVLDPRLDLFFNCFPSRKYDAQQVDTLSCPYIPLPESWDRFSLDFAGRWTRRDINRFFRRLEERNGFRMTCVQADNLEAQMEALLKLLQSRWETREQALNVYRAIFRRCFENDSLWLSVLWDRTEPIAGLAAFVDRQKRTFAAYVAAYDEKYSRLSPGKGMCGYSIRYAIQNGFRIFDFLRGDADYKFLFGAVERFNRSAVLRRKSLRMTAGRLIKRWGDSLKEIR